MTTNLHLFTLKFIRINSIRRKPNRIPTIVAALIANPFWANSVSAHGFAFRYDLPLPLNFYLIGAGAAVCFSFVVMAYVLQSRTMLDSYRISLTRFIPHINISQAALILIRLISIFLLLLIIISGLFGNQSPLKNLAPVTVWVIWWVGFVYITSFVANTWPIVNPWSSIFQAVEQLSGKSFGKTPYPDWLGVWPALVLFILFTWIELVWSGSEQPRLLAITIVSYSVLCWTGMAVYGHQTWLQRAEIFSIIFAIFGRFSPLETNRSQGGPYLRPYGVGLLSRQPPSISLTAFVVTMLATVTFDGFMETPIWLEIKTGVLSTASLVPSLLLVRGVFGNLDSVLETIGLMSAPIAFLSVYLVTCWMISQIDSIRGNRNSLSITTIMAARWFVLSLVPIAIAYHLAHYLSYFLIAGQLFIPLLSDPLGLGWDLFNTASHRVNIGIINAKTVWHISIVVIVLGHVIAVYLAHVTALRVLKDRRRALASQLPMIALMVGYTSFSLWILAQPIVTN